MAPAGLIENGAPADAAAVSVLLLAISFVLVLGLRVLTGRMAAPGASSGAAG